jgi:hypothetical protein
MQGLLMGDSIYAGTVLLLETVHLSPFPDHFFMLAN